MDRLEIAQKIYERIAPRPLEVDQEKSNELEAWLRDYVLPVVADLQRNPAFRRHVQFGVERLTAGSDSRERQQVVAVSDALVACATELTRVGSRDEFRDLMRDRDLLQELNEREYGASLPEREPNAKHDARCIAERMAERPWFDLAMNLDFPYREDHLFVDTDDQTWFCEAFDRFRPDMPVLGDGVTRMLFARVEFWGHHLMNVWNQVHVRIMQTSDDPHNEYERFFMTRVHLDECVKELRAMCLSGNKARLRDACCTLMQVYIVYHPRPQLPWLNLTEDRFQSPAGLLSLEFRRPCELTEYEQVDSRTIREVGRRQANIVMMDSIHRVVAALEDVAELYRCGLSPEEIIEEARTQYRLVVVTKPRLVFWDGVELGIRWDSKHTSWEILLHLAAHAAKYEGIDQFDLSGTMSHRALSVRKYNLCKHLTEAGDESPGPQLAARIVKPKGGDCYIDLEPNNVKVLDLEGLGADEWTVDRAEFALTGR